MKKALFLSILVLTLFTACKKEVNNVGLSVLHSDNDAFGSVDTFSLQVGSVLVDTVTTSKPSYLLLGSYVDPIFGKYDAGFYSHVRISATNPNFGDTALITIDSLILGMRYSDYYGKLDEQTFEVYEIKEDMLASSSYANKSKVAISLDNLVLPSSSKLTPKPYGYSFAQYANDTVYDNIRLSLDTKLAKRFIKDTKTSPASFASVDNFVSYFKGLYVKVANTNQASGEGAVMSFAYPPRLTIYYKLNGVVKTFYFELNGSGVRFNHVETDYSGTDVEKLVLGQTKDQKYFYAQANHVRGVVSLTTVSNIPANSIIHYAKLILPVDFDNTNVYPLSNELFVSIPNSLNDPTLRYISTAVLDTVSKGYSVDLRDHIQKVITGKRLNYPLLFSPKFFSYSAERIQFLGPNSGALKPRLLIKYSSF